MEKEVKRVKMIVAYDGTNYKGWQVQPNGITIEEVLTPLRASAKYTGMKFAKPLAFFGASSDANALHQMVQNWHSTQQPD